ncbi:MAG TPA: hypothetical protein VI893_01880 [Thermoplasmata archaeon]|nr:hypothetical protein [Thermoplasmata archaeon]
MRRKSGKLKVIPILQELDVDRRDEERPCGPATIVSKKGKRAASAIREERPAASDSPG